MSGGFFRGTSADQDTRFSNKQAKLLKSQKFAPDLDHLVDMTKVKMDVIRPWIATRATELLGFEDEVLINFVYGLLDAKEVDGKQIQIQLTGFMEKNTGKFMKELWSLLLSAQNNVSGVPQQFLDAKEEETRKKKAETDRIAQEIQKRRERDGREPERERKSRFDGEADDSKFTKAASDSVSKFSKPRASSVQPEEDKEVDGRHGSRAKNGHSISPPPKDRSPSPSRVVSSPTRSNNKSISRSRSYSEERHKSRSLSVSSRSPRNSVSPGRHYKSPERRPLSPKRRYRSPPRRSISPRRGHSPRGARSPARRRSPHLRRRSRSQHRSPSPYRYRSPLARRRSPRRRSRSLLRHRSPSPLRRRSPSPRRHRSPSPYRRRSPLPRRRSPPYRRRSPSPSRRRSPFKARRRSPSPVLRRSPIQNRSVSPARGRSPSPPRMRSPPPRSPKHRRRSPLPSPKSHPADSSISPPQRKRSRSPYRSPSPSHRNRRSLSREHDRQSNGNESRRYRDEQTSGRATAKKSPANHASERELAERSGSKQKVPEGLSRKVPISLRSPQRDMGNQSGDRKKMPVVSPENSLSYSEFPIDMRKVNPRASRRSRSLSKSPVRQTNIQMPRQDNSPGTSKEQREVSRRRTESSHKRSKDSPRDGSPESYSPDRREFNQSPIATGRPLHSDLKKKDIRQGSDARLPERHVQQRPNSSEEKEYTPGRVREERGSRGRIHDRQLSTKLLKSDLDRAEGKEQAVDDERRHRQGGDEYNELHRGTESITRSKKKNDKKSRVDTRDSDSEETNSYRNENVEKKKHKKSDKRKRDYDETSESDSQIEDKKEAKRRRKDEKRLRKEERRRRREERHRRKLERRADKIKVKSIDTVSPPDFEMNHGDAGGSDGGAGRRKNSHPSEADETESEQKKLEIALREKALESLRAKKAISY